MASVVPIDYTSKDYDGFRQSMLDYAGEVYNEWTGRSKADFGVTLVELFAYMGDILSYYDDRAAREAFITTASQRSSVLNHATVLGYVPHGYVASTGQVTFQTNADQATSVVVPAGTLVMTDFVNQYDGPILFETQADVTVPATGGQVNANVVQGETRGGTAKIKNAGTGSQANVSVTQIGVSDGTMDQTFRLPEAPIVEGSVRLFVDDTASANPAAVLEWAQTTSLLDSTPTDKVFEVYIDETSKTYVRLGDGTNGIIPASGVRVYAIYRVGGGVKGNIDAGKITGLVTPIIGVKVKDSASAAMTGGVDAEDTESVRRNAPRAFRTQNRIVTLTDFQDAALTIAGVTKAKAITGPASTSVKVFIVGPNNTDPSSGLLTSVTNSIQAKALAGTTVSVSKGSPVYVNVGTSASPVRVGVYAHFSTADVQVAVESAISALFTSAATSLGQRVGVSSIYAAASAVPGVAYVVIPMVARSTDTQTGVNDILCREWEFPVIGAAYVTAETTQ